MTDQKPARFRRFLAFWLDVILTALCTIPLEYLLAQAHLSGAAAMAVALALLVPMMLFACRDFLLNGRSVGKRVLGLAVVDRESGRPAGAKQLAVKGLFLFFYFFDGLFLLFSGRSLAERATNTAVIRSRAASGPLSKKRWLVVIAVALAVVVGLCAVVFAAMNAAKKAEGYQPAHDYLTASDAFAALGAEDGDVSLTGFSFSTSYGAGTHGTVQSFTFRVQDESFTVTCHPAGDSWTVCGECTDFE